MAKITSLKPLANGRELTVSCCFATHFPPSLRVTWLKRDLGAPSDTICDTVSYPGDSYISCLLGPGNRDYGIWYMPGKACDPKIPLTGND